MKAVIFDVDGTLWDSTEKVAISWRMTCARRGVPCRQITGERLKQEFGKLLPDIGRSVFPELPEDAVLRLTEECCEEENRYLLADPPKTYEGIYELFRTLSGRMPVFIVSNCQAGYIEAMLEASGLGSFVTDHLCPGDTGEAKAANIQRIIDRYQLTDAVYVGDTAGDAKAAADAGIPFIFADYGFGRVKEAAATIHTPAELLMYVDMPFPLIKNTDGF